MNNFLDSIVSTLPAKAQPYAKTYAASLMAALTVVSAAIPESPHWLTIVLAILGAPVVYSVPNKDPLASKQDESVQPPVTEAAVKTSSDAGDPANL